MTSEKLFFPIPLLLGDLYLWNGQYENAAREYYALIEDKNYVIDDTYNSIWTVDNGVFVERDPFEQNYQDIFELTTSEQITLIAGSTKLGEVDELYKLTFENYEVSPSRIAVNNWEGKPTTITKEQRIPEICGDPRDHISAWDPTPAI